jgi:cysteine desulfuration protein SufE
MLEFFASMERGKRMEALIDLAAKFREPPPRVAIRPFPPSHRVPGCESEAYVWAEELPDHSLKYYFAVENPQGVSAKATAVILDKVLSGAPLQEVLQIPPEIIYQIFGQELSMGKNLGLTNMLVMCQAAARKYLASVALVPGSS